MTVFHRPRIGEHGDPAAHIVDSEVSQEFLDRIPGGIFRYRADDRAAIDYVNSGLVSMVGCSDYEQFREFTGNSFWGIVHPDDIERVRTVCDPDTVIDEDRVRYRIRRPDGQVRWVDDHGRLVTDSEGNRWFYVTVLDVTETVELQEELDLAHERLETLAMLDSYQRRAERDGLTNVLNRSGGTEHIRTQLEQADGRPCSFFIIDVDDFKTINDTFGHPAGDRVLMALARHLSNTVRLDDVVARFGGDEFVVFAMGLGAGPALEGLAGRITNNVFPRSRASDRELAFAPPTLSVGVATSADSSATFEALYHAADGALYKAKQRGKDAVVITGV